MNDERKLEIKCAIDSALSYYPCKSDLFARYFIEMQNLARICEALLAELEISEYKMARTHKLLKETMNQVSFLDSLLNFVETK